MVSQMLCLPVSAGELLQSNHAGGVGIEIMYSLLLVVSRPLRLQIKQMNYRPTLATCETSQLLLAGVPGVFSRASPIFAPPTDWPVLYKLK